MEKKSFVTHSMSLAKYCNKRTITRTISKRILTLDVGGNVGGGLGVAPTNE